MRHFPREKQKTEEQYKRNINLDMPISLTIKKEQSRTIKKTHNQHSNTHRLKSIKPKDLSNLGQHSIKIKGSGFQDSTLTKKNIRKTKINKKELHRGISRSSL